MTQNFAGRVRELRNKKGLSKSALARTVGVTTTCVWNWEEGNTHPRPAALSRIATALSTTEAFLERGVPPREPPSTTSAIPSGRAHAPVGEVILRAREEIAAAAGLSLYQVKVVLEYGA
jgi:transcriptional regulator with XRE-family HTH domain